MADEKFIDESWKDAVADEKEKGREEKGINPTQKEPSKEPLVGGTEARKEGVPEVNFIGYITSLAFQAMIFLGEIPNPLTNEVEKNIPQAKFLIDTLVLLREKTIGNLDQNENEALNGFVYELQMKYVEVVNKEEKT